MFITSIKNDERNKNACKQMVHGYSKTFRIVVSKDKRNAGLLLC